MDTIKILGPNESRDFHDSSLVDLIFNPVLNHVVIIVSTSDEYRNENLWEIKLTGILHLEFETVGDGSLSDTAPVEVYEIYNDTKSKKYLRWKRRLDDIHDVNGKIELYNIILASSFFRGWGENDELEGINIVCRKVEINKAPNIYDNKKYSRHRIEARDDEES